MADYRRFVLMRTGREGRVATVATARGETLYECLERNGRPIRTRCRGSTICGLCRVDVASEDPRLTTPRPDEQALLDRVAPGRPHVRLACCLILPDDLDVAVVSTDYW